MLIKAVKACPKEIPGRDKKLFDQYLDFGKSSEDVVKLYVPVHLDRLKQIDVDNESDQKKRQIIFHLIKVYTDSDFEFEW